MTRITEKQLILPALYIMKKIKEGFISTSDLITCLTNVMRPTGLDAEILAGRNDTYFSQKVRNLKSHDTLQKHNFATNYDNGFKITPLGAEYVTTHQEALVYLFNEEFSYEDVKTAIDNISQVQNRKVLPIEEFVSEGRNIAKNIKAYERSSRLRTIAIEHFTRNNMISCDCCGFNFPNFYGELYGKDCIEIHHIKPIFQYQSDTFEQTIESALMNLLPVCPNCHRIIHKNNIGSEKIDAFIKYMKQK